MKFIWVKVHYRIDFLSLVSRESPEWLLMPWCPKFWEGGTELWMIFCQSVSVVSTLKGGRGIRTLTFAIKFVWTFLRSEAVWMLKHCSRTSISSDPTSYLAKLSLHNVSFICSQPFENVTVSIEQFCSLEEKLDVTKQMRKKQMVFPVSCFNVNSWHDFLRS